MAWWWLGKLRQKGGAGYRRRDPTIDGAFGNEKKLIEKQKKFRLDNTPRGVVLRQPFPSLLQEFAIA
jgi:hypothetical protein